MDGFVKIGANAQPRDLQSLMASAVREACEPVLTEKLPDRLTELLRLLDDRCSDPAAPRPARDRVEAGHQRRPDGKAGI